MHCSIVTDNLRQAEFIKKGLYYEHLSCDIYSSDDFDGLEQELPFADGILFLFHDMERLQESFDFCKNLTGGSMPFIILAQRNSAELNEFVKNHDVLLFVRPFSFRRIAAEMKMLIFMVKEHVEESSFIVRDLELDLMSHRVQCRKQSLHLRNKEFALLHYLMVHKGKVLSRSEILENVWDRNADILTNTVDVHVSQLRKKISSFTPESYIHTVPCKGYFLA
ncbi:MAG: response regulator transcription factor [Candidatus Gracilibacteria bacterium]|nr:response regulator transcription factor [Candidatus Peregrinibacteria bacterium]